MRKRIEEQRKGRVKLESKVPKINKDLFMKLTLDGEKIGDKKKAKKGELLEDNRFGALFTDERFEVDTTEETYRLLNPVVSKLDKDKRKEFDAKYGVRESGSEGEGGDSEDDEIMKESEDDREESSDDDQEWTKQLKKEHKNIQSEKAEEKKLKRMKKQEQKLKNISSLASKTQQHVLEEVKAGSEFQNVTEQKSKSKLKKSKLSLEERLETETFDPSSMKRMESGHVMTFTPEKSQQSVRQEEKEKEHRRERLAVRRFVFIFLPPKNDFYFFQVSESIEEGQSGSKVLAWKTSEIVQINFPTSFSIALNKLSDSYVSEMKCNTCQCPLPASGSICPCGKVSHTACIRSWSLQVEDASFALFGF